MSVPDCGRVGSRTDRRFDSLSLGSFVVLGLPDGILGTAWPAMRQTFGEPVGGLGLILLANTAGAVAVAAVVGRLIRRWGVATLLAVAASCAAVGGLGYAFAPGLWLILSIGVLMGAAAGMMDGGLNTALALTKRRRLLNLLHGFYGIGTALGPLLVTAAIVAGSWRPAYLVLVGLDVTCACLWVGYRRSPKGGPHPPAPGPETEPIDAHAASPDIFTEINLTEGWSPRRVVSVLALGLTVFFVYTGLEVGAGQWETSFLRGTLDLSVTAAGLAAFGYWGALTAVRIALALPSKSVEPLTVIRWGSLLSVAATAVIWWQPGTAVTVVAFVVLGAALAGVFPALVAITPQRIGARRAQDAIAWQVGAAAAGGSAISALIGLLISVSNLGIVGPALTALAVVLVAANTALTRLTPGRQLARPTPKETGTT